MSHLPAHATRRGGAILLVLAAAAVLTFVVTGALAAAAEQHRQALLERAVLQAELSAELAGSEPLAAWDARTVAGVGEWQAHASLPVGTSSNSLARSIAPGLWRIDATGEWSGEALPTLARRSRVRHLRARPPALSLTAPLTLRGTLHLHAGATLGTAGANPPGWPGCTLPGAAVVVAVSLLPGASLSGPTTPSHASVPDTVETVLLEALSILPGGDPRSLEPIIEHTALSNPALEASSQSPATHCALGTAPDPLPPLNWGDPARPSSCSAYMPYVRVGGNLISPTGSGQGVLVVDGDLSTYGGFTWAGLIVVRGNLRLIGSDVRIHGAVAALGPGPHEIGDGVEVQWSPCTVLAALRANAMVTPVTGTPWSALR
jgi:hypothetical protein